MWHYQYCQIQFSLGIFGVIFISAFSFRFCFPLILVMSLYQQIKNRPIFSTWIFCCEIIFPWFFSDQCMNFETQMGKISLRKCLYEPLGGTLSLSINTVQWQDWDQPVLWEKKSIKETFLADALKWAERVISSALGFAPLPPSTSLRPCKATLDILKGAIENVLLKVIITQATGSVFVPNSDQSNF